jgi:cellulose biosynthesis protein BcsQ
MPLLPKELCALGHSTPLLASRPIWSHVALAADWRLPTGPWNNCLTWFLGDVVSSFPDTRVLIFDLDAQMSLTQAIALNEDTGKMQPKFQKWYDVAIARSKTIFHALDQFTKPGTKFDFGVGLDFIYQITENLHFIPSVEDLYWLHPDRSVPESKRIPARV